MYIFTLSAAGRKIGQTPLFNQAMRYARTLAAAHNAPVIVECSSLATGETRRVQVNADGSTVKLWEVAA